MFRSAQLGVPFRIYPVNLVRRIRWKGNVIPRSLEPTQSCIPLWNLVGPKYRTFHRILPVECLELYVYVLILKPSWLNVLSSDDLQQRASRIQLTNIWIGVWAQTKTSSVTWTSTYGVNTGGSKQWSGRVPFLKQTRELGSLAGPLMIGWLRAWSL